MEFTNIRHELLRNELAETQKNNIFRGLWVSMDDEKRMDILALIQSFTQYSRHIAKRRLKTLMNIFQSKLKFDDQKKTWYSDLNTSIEILTFFIPSIIKEVKDYIANTFCGQTEVPCKWGKIDVMNSDHIFFIEEVEKWESVLGRIIVCSPCFPNHCSVLVVLTEENDDNEFLEYIIQTCLEYDIKPLRVFKKNNKIEHEFMDGCENCGACLESIQLSNHGDEEEDDSETEESKESNEDEESSCDEDCECNECQKESK